MSFQQDAGLEEPGPAYVKTVLISNMHCRRQKSQVSNASCCVQMSKCGDYDDIYFLCKQRVLWYSNSCLLSALKKITLSQGDWVPCMNESIRLDERKTMVAKSALYLK